MFSEYIRKVIDSLEAQWLEHQTIVRKGMSSIRLFVSHLWEDEHLSFLYRSRSHNLQYIICALYGNKQRYCRHGHHSNKRPM